ncbi:unnamed protein product [Arctogadus glacialis]
MSPGPICSGRGIPRYSHSGNGPSPIGEVRQVKLGLRWGRIQGDIPGRDQADIMFVEAPEGKDDHRESGEKQRQVCFGIMDHWFNDSPKIIDKDNGRADWQFAASREVTVNHPRGAGAGQVQGGGMSTITQTQQTREMVGSASKRTQAPHPNDCCMVLTSLTRPDQLDLMCHLH